MPRAGETLYKPEYCDIVIELGKLGYSMASMAAELGVAKQTLYNWTHKHEELMDAIKVAKTYAQAWYEDQGRKGIWAGSSFNNHTWAKQISCMFPEDYREVQQVNTLKKVDISEEDKQILERLGVIVDD